MGTLGFVERRGPMGGESQPAGAHSRVAITSFGRDLGQRQRWIAARSGLERLSPGFEPGTFADCRGRYCLACEPLLERHPHGGSVCMAATLLLVQRSVRSGAGFV